MRKLIPISLLFIAAIGFYSFVSPVEESDYLTEVKWYTFEEAVAANKTNPKKFMVDVYTDWCGWCKRMDKATFQQEEISKYLNENFYAVKLDAEMKTDVAFKGHTFNYVPNAGRKGVHTLAYSLLEGSMSYPSIVFLDENVDRIMVSKGYKGPEDFIKELKYAAEDHYKKTSLNAFKAGK